MDKKEVRQQLMQVAEVVENDDGTMDLKLDLSEEFVAWFKEKEGLKNWSQKRVEGFFKDNLQEVAKDLIAKASENK